MQFVFELVVHPSHTICTYSIKKPTHHAEREIELSSRSLQQSFILRGTKPHVMKAFTEKKEQFDAWLKTQSDPVRAARTQRWTMDEDDEADGLKRGLERSDNLGQGVRDWTF